MNAYNVCTFIGRVPTHDSFKPVFAAGDENKRARYSATLSVKRDRKKPEEQFYPEDLIRFTAWGATAEYINKYAPPGTTIAITGSLNVDNVPDQQGNKRIFHTIMVDSVRVIGSSKQENGQSQQQQQQQTHIEEPPAEVFNPFHKGNQPASAVPAQSEQSNPATAEGETERFNPFHKGQK